MITLNDLHQRLAFYFDRMDKATKAHQRQDLRTPLRHTNAKASAVAAAQRHATIPTTTKFVQWNESAAVTARPLGRRSEGVIQNGKYITNLTDPEEKEGESRRSVPALRTRNVRESNKRCAN